MASAALLHADGPPPRSPQVRLWRVLRLATQAHSLGELFDAADIEPELFFSLIENWTAQGALLTQLQPLRFMMTEAARSRVHPPRAVEARARCTVPKFSGRQRLWAAMRVLKEFDLPTLCMAAEVGEKGAREFLGGLLRFRYLTIRKGNPDGLPVYKLARNTGPRHPVIRRRNDGSRSIVELDDRNNGQSLRDVVDFSLPAGKGRLDGGGVS
jgi:hypothetical protein